MVGLDLSVSILGTNIQHPTYLSLFRQESSGYKSGSIYKHSGVSKRQPGCALNKDSVWGFWELLAARPVEDIPFFVATDSRLLRNDGSWNVV
jgi:hypothetical protein